MKVLWLCNGLLRNLDAGGSGPWQGAMAGGLLDSGAIELGIIAVGQGKQFTRCDYRQVKQWLVPSVAPVGRTGLPTASLVQAIVTAVKEFSPDLVHSWGTEYFWGLLPARGLFTYPALLEMQGLKAQCAKVFFGGLTLPERLRCAGVKELLKRRTMGADRREYARWGMREVEIIRGHRFIDVQSSWVASQVRAIAPDARLFPVHRALRQAFYDTDDWHPAGQPTLFCTAAYTQPFKGLHVAVRALALLRKRIPEARLRIAGDHQHPGIRQNGYIRWINRMIRQLALADAIDWLGPLNAQQVVEELKNAAAVVIPTFMENCCNAMQEAMAVGTPVVVSYVGGIPSLGKDEDSCLFFPPGDEAMCAYQLERVLSDPDLALRLSRRSQKIALDRNNRQRIVQRQLEIYRQMVELA